VGKTQEKQSAKNADITKKLPLKKKKKKKKQKKIKKKKKKKKLTNRLEKIFQEMRKKGVWLAFLIELNKQKTNIKEREKDEGGELESLTAGTVLEPWGREASVGWAMQSLGDCF